MSFERTTPCGVISGTACQWPGIAAYKGIRYATAGRWEFPIPVTHWDGVYDATQYGACCYQPRAFYDEAAAPGKAFYYNEFRKGETYTYSEDCLFLNIWAPADAAPGDRLPVIFYIHGGGFTGQAGAIRHGISRALVLAGEDKDKIKKAGFLTRDPRMKERKKYGLHKARKAPQFSKR